LVPVRAPELTVNDDSSYARGGLRAFIPDVASSLLVLLVLVRLLRAMFADRAALVYLQAVYSE